MISPPGLSTRANSSSVASGSGTAVMTYCATTTSKDASGKREMLGVHHRQRLDVGRARARRRAPAPCAASAPRCRRRRGGCCARSRAARCRCRRRLRGCAAGRHALRPPRSRPGGRARTPRRTRGRRPAPSAHRPSRSCPGRAPPAIAPSTQRNRLEAAPLARVAAAALRMKPPPSTRAWPCARRRTRRPGRARRRPRRRPARPRRRPRRADSHAALRRPRRAHLDEHLEPPVVEHARRARPRRSS